MMAEIEQVLFPPVFRARTQTEHSSPMLLLLLSSHPVSNIISWLGIFGQFYMDAQSYHKTGSAEEEVEDCCLRTPKQQQQAEQNTVFSAESFISTRGGGDDLYKKWDKAAEGYRMEGRQAGQSAAVEQTTTGIDWTHRN